jgi:hypothetical protein
VRDVNVGDEQRWRIRFSDIDDEYILVIKSEKRYKKMPGSLEPGIFLRHSESLNEILEDVRLEGCAGEFAQGSRVDGKAVLAELAFGMGYD